MKHLKRFSAVHSLLKQSNEALERDYEDDFTQETLDDIEDYCELNLAYLLDLGMSVKCSNTIDDYSDVHECQVELSFDDTTYSTILDQVIPFFKRIKNDYHLGTWLAHPDANFCLNSSSGKYFISDDGLDNIENDLVKPASAQRNIKAGFDVKIYSIIFYIQDEK